MQTYREWFNEQTLLTEMATDRKKAEKVINGLGDEIFKHLIKILYWIDDINYNKHINDIDTWLNKVDKIEIKPKSSRLKKSDYYNWLYDELHSSSSQLRKSIKFISKEYGKLQKSGLNEEDLYLKLKQIYTELSLDLHSDNFNSIKDYLNE